jgi:5-methylcytosine-specific restriction endonuclease McrA
MTFEQQLHQKTLTAAQDYQRTERELFRCLLDVDRYKVYLSVGATSLFEYAVKTLSLTEPVAYNFVSVVKKSREVPELKQQVESGELSISKARKLVSIIKPENQAELLAFTRKATYRDIEKKIAELSPKKGESRLKPSGHEEETLHLTVPSEVANNFRRAQDLLSSRRRRNVDFAECFAEIVHEFLCRMDPLEKAKRFGVTPKSIRRATKKVEGSVRRRKSVPTAATLRQVDLRDEGQCTHITDGGERCSQRRWLHVHHIRSKVFGGGNELENLKTLCQAHHRMVHIPGSKYTC